MTQEDPSCGCQLATAHAAGCPLYPGLPVYPAPGLPGWVCPRCGGVYSPFTPQCWRCTPQQWVITCKDTGHAGGTAAGRVT